MGVATNHRQDGVLLVKTGAEVSLSISPTLKGFVIHLEFTTGPHLLAVLGCR